VLPEGRIKDKIMLFFFKLLKNRYLQVLIKKENSTLGHYIIGMYNFLYAPNNFDVKDRQPLNVYSNNACLYLKCFLRSYPLLNSGCHSKRDNNILLNMNRITAAY